MCDNEQMGDKIGQVFEQTGGVILLQVPDLQKVGSFGTSIGLNLIRILILRW
jgi:hypothetical protein